MDDGATSTASSPARCSGPRPMWAGSSAIPTSSMRRCCMAAPPILYEGKPVGTPDAGAFWRVIAEHGVVALFTAPTAFRAIKKEDPEGELLETLRPLPLPRAVPRRRARRSRHGPMGRGHLQRAGHRPLVADGNRLARSPATRWASARFRSSTARPRCRCRATTSRCWTRAASRCRRTPWAPSSIKLPLPPGAPADALAGRRALQGSYLSDFPGYYNTSDAGYIDEDGYVWVMGRTDDIINVAGHRLSTGGMEEVLASHPASPNAPLSAWRMR